MVIRVAAFVAIFCGILLVWLGIASLAPAINEPNPSPGPAPTGEV